MSLISAENISCYRGRGAAAGAGGDGQGKVFAALSFALAAGELCHLQGANGSGKSSLLLLCAGLLRVQDGRLDVRATPHFVAAGKSSLHPKMSVAENLRFLARLFGGGGGGGDDSADNIRRALAFWRAEALSELMPHSLSAGQKKAVALARLIVVPRALWLLDEPFSALDAPRTALLEQAIARHLETGGAVLIAEHHKTLSGRVLNMELF